MKKYRSKTIRRTKTAFSYLMENPFCEMSRYLCKLVPSLGLSRQEDATEVNHIFGGCRRLDDTKNMVAVCRTAHDWFHRNLADGRLLCVWLKMEKEEMSPEDFRRITGFSLDGWISVRTFSKPFQEIKNKLLLKAFSK